MPLPSHEILTGHLENLHVLEDQLIQKALGETALIEIELLTDAVSAVSSSLSDDEIETLRFLDNVHGYTEPVYPRMAITDTRDLLRDIASEGILPIKHMDNMYLSTIFFYQNKDIRFGTVGFSGTFNHEDDQPVFGSIEFSTGDDDSRVDTPSGILVTSGSEAAWNELTRNLARYILENSDFSNPKPLPARIHTLTTLPLEKTPYELSHISSHLSAWEQKYTHLLALPDSELQRLIAAEKER